MTAVMNNKATQAPKGMPRFRRGEGGTGGLGADWTGIGAGAAGTGAGAGWGERATGGFTGAGGTGRDGRGAGAGWGALPAGAATVNDDWHLRQRAVFPANEAGTRSAEAQLGHRMEIVSSLMAIPRDVSTPLDNLEASAGNRKPAKRAGNRNPAKRAGNLTRPAGQAISC
ncbi:MAG: hypothetical protein ACKO9Z_10515 [Planctomycetota bacterium]